jgi:hypothetical protein
VISIAEPSPVGATSVVVWSSLAGPVVSVDPSVEHAVAMVTKTARVRIILATLLGFLFMVSSSIDIH